MRLAGVGMLAIDSSRTRAYLGAMEDASLAPEKIVLLDAGRPPDPPPPSVPQFDNATTATERAARMGVPVVTVGARSPNDAETVAAVAAGGCHTLVYSGPGGAILRDALLRAGPRFLHVHPGRLPELRGSTTVYYDLLQRGRCSASALFLDASIDTGPILAVRDYPAPADRTAIDHGHDPAIRADLLVRVLREYVRAGLFQQRPQPAEGTTYYIAHPVLRHVAVLAADAGASPHPEPR